MFNQKRIRQLEQQLRETCDKLDRAHKETEEAIRATATAAGFLQELRADPPGDPQVLAAFTIAHDETPWWRAILHILQAQADEERNNTCLPGLTSEAAHYNRGRCAALLDHLETLLALRAKAQKQSS